MSETAQAPTTASNAVPPTTQAPVAAKKASSPIHRLLRYAILLFLLFLLANPSVLPFLPTSLTASLVGFSGMASLFDFNWIGLLEVVAMVLMLLLLNEVLHLALKWYKPSTGRAKTLTNLFASSSQYILIFVGAFWGLSLLGVNISTLFASVGILALIVGFGAESLISDVITGLFMIFENQYNIGDVIEIDGYRGTVSAIGVRTTSVTDTGDNEKIFNNSDMRNIINLSHSHSYAISDICVPYEADLEQVKLVIEKILAAVQAKDPVLFETTPKLYGILEMTEYGVVLRVAVTVSEKDRYKAAYAMNWALKNGLQEAGMGVPHTSEVTFATDYLCNKVTSHE